MEIRLTNFPESNKPIRIYDCRGIARDNEQNIQTNKAFEDDLMKAIDGHIMKDYEVKCMYMSFGFLKAKSHADDVMFY